MERLFFVVMFWERVVSGGVVPGLLCSGSRTPRDKVPITFVPVFLKILAGPLSYSHRLCTILGSLHSHSAHQISGRLLYPTNSYYIPVVMILVFTPLVGQVVISRALVWDKRSLLMFWIQDLTVDLRVKRDLRVTVCPWT